MKIDGSCHCGEIKYEAEVDTEKVMICNCVDCQTLSGSAFRVNVYVDASNLKLLLGEPSEYVRTAESGNKRVQAFAATVAPVSMQQARMGGHGFTLCGGAPLASVTSWCPSGRYGSARGKIGYPTWTVSPARKSSNKADRAVRLKSGCS